MATYLPGVTDTIPQIQPWQPNYNFYEHARGVKQQQFDKGWNKVNNVYNSILNAPMMRTDNNETRDEYFDNIKNEINKIAGVDLSLEQNSQAAAQIFEPFYNNEGIVKDMAFTANYQDETKHAEGLRRCTDVEKCGDDYWEGGVRLMQYQAQDFVNATAEEALGISNVKYVPHVNFMKKATVAAKEAGLSVEYDKVGNGWITTYKNGEALQQPLMNYFMGVFGEDPRLKDYNFAKAGLMLRENPDQAQQIYQAYINNDQITEEDAKKQIEEAHAKSQYDKSKNHVKGELSKQESIQYYTNKKKGIEEKNIAENGVIPGSQQARTFEEMISTSNAQEKIVNGLQNTNKVINNTDGLINEFGIKSNMRQMQSVIANSLLMKDMYGAAKTLSMKDASITRKVDPYAMENTQQANRISLANIKNRNTILAGDIDALRKRTLEQWKIAVDRGKVDPSGALLTNPEINIFKEMDKDIEALRTAHNTPFSKASMGTADYNKTVAGGDSRKAAQVGSEMVTHNGGGPSQVTSSKRVNAYEQATKQSIVDGNKLTESKDKISDTNILDGIANILEGIDPEGILKGKLDDPYDKANEITNLIKYVGQDAMNKSKQLNGKGQGMKYNFVTDILKNLYDDASDGDQTSQLQALGLGEALTETFNQNGVNQSMGYEHYALSYASRTITQGYSKLLDREDFSVLKDMPSFVKNHKNNNSEYYSKVAGMGVEKLINTIGLDNAYSILSSTKPMSMQLGANDYIHINFGTKASSPKMFNAFNNNISTVSQIDANNKAAEVVMKTYNSSMTNAIKDAKRAAMDDTDKSYGALIGYFYDNALDKKKGNFAYLKNVPTIVDGAIQDDIVPRDGGGYFGMDSRSSSYSILDFSNEFKQDAPLSDNAQLKLIAGAKPGSAWDVSYNIDAVKSLEKNESFNNKAIAGKRFDDDLKLPEEKRKYKTVHDAYKEVEKESPYRNMPRDGSGQKLSLDYVDFISDNYDAFEYRGGDGAKVYKFTVTPNLGYWDKHSGESNSRDIAGYKGWDPYEVSFDLKALSVSQKMVNEFSELKNAMPEIMAGVGESMNTQINPTTGKPGMGTTSSYATKMNITADVKNQAFYMSENIIKEAIETGIFYPGMGNGSKDELQTVLSSLNKPNKYGEAIEYTLEVLPSKNDDYSGTHTNYELKLTNPEWEKAHDFNVENFKGATKNDLSRSYKFGIKNANDPITKSILGDASTILINNLKNRGHVDLNTGSDLLKIRFEKNNDRVYTKTTIQVFNTKTAEWQDKVLPLVGYEPGGNLEEYIDGLVRVANAEREKSNAEASVVKDMFKNKIK